MPDILSLKMLGIAGVISYASARLAAKAGIIGFRRFALVSVPLSSMPTMPRGYTVQELDAATLANFSIDVPQPVQIERFAQGLHCLGAFNRRGDLVGVTWLGLGPHTETLIHATFVVPEGAAWDTGLWIAPRHRLGRSFAALWAGTGEWLGLNGKICSMSWIIDYNLPSLMSHKRMGAVTIGHISTFRLFRWQYMAAGRPKVLRVDRDQPANIFLPRTTSEALAG